MPDVSPLLPSLQKKLESLREAHEASAQDVAKKRLDVQAKEAELAQLKQEHAQLKQELRDQEIAHQKLSGSFDESQKAFGRILHSTHALEGLLETELGRSAEMKFGSTS
jgi:Skp family chaperone for outer membrane proteins